MEEVWAEVANYPKYAVSNYGRVINLEKDRLLKQLPNDNGYLRVFLYNEDGVRQFYIHQLVAAAFFKEYRERSHVRHVNGDKSNNSVSNLRLRGRRDLYRERERIHRKLWGRRIRIVETGEVFRTVRDCAAYIGGDYSTIYRCLRGERPNHLGYSFEYYDE